MKTCAKIIGSTFGCGFSPLAPGTVGSLFALILLWFVSPLSNVLLISLVILFFVVGVWAATECEKDWGHDAGRIVWDEVVGMMVAVVALPANWMVFLGAFAAFRFFDILKPFPINASQRLPHGWGVMVDDLLAGIYANIVLQILVRVFFTSLVG